MLMSVAGAAEKKKLPPELRRCLLRLCGALPDLAGLTRNRLADEALLTGFTCFSTSSITRKQIPHGEFWTWRQNNRKRMVDLGTHRVIITKLTSRPVAGADRNIAAIQPRKSWIVEVCQGSGTPVWFFWVERGNGPGWQRMDTGDQSLSYPIVLPVTTPEDFAPSAGSNPTEHSLGPAGGGRDESNSPLSGAFAAPEPRKVLLGGPAAPPRLNLPFLAPPSSSASAPISLSGRASLTIESSTSWSQSFQGSDGLDLGASVLDQPPVVWPPSFPYVGGIEVSSAAWTDAGSALPELTAISPTDWSEWLSFDGSSR